jgi:copper chaperone NosL
MVTLSSEDTSWLEEYSRDAGISMAEAIRQGIKGLRERERSSTYTALAATRGTWRKGDGRIPEEIARGMLRPPIAFHRHPTLLSIPSPQGRRRVMRLLVPLLLASLLWAGDAMSGEKGPVVPSPKDKCPVCGMFVKKYPDWIGQVIFKDGSYAVFDGAKDLFKFYHDMSKYSPGRRQTDIDSIYVTDYYSLHLIDGRKADYVIGSDVYGPMGKELIPFANGADAKGFMKDHKGKGVLKFDEVTPSLLKGLD